MLNFDNFDKVDKIEKVEPKLRKFAEPTAQRRVGSRANLSFCKIFNLA